MHVFLTAERFLEVKAGIVIKTGDSQLNPGY